MRWFWNLSIRQKLMRLVMLTSSAALLIACSVLAVYDSFSFRQTTAHDLSTLATITGSNSTAALTFGDPNAAREILGALSAQQHLVAACIYGKDGTVFAKYVRADAAAKFTPPTLEKEGTHFAHNRVLLFQKIRLDGEPIGTIYLESDLGEVQARLWEFAEIVVLVLFGSLLVAFLLSARLQRAISGPILHLAQTASLVSLEEDYSIRATQQ